MDRAVVDAIAKWPNVPACTGWLLLDRRGQWRMRDDACQAAGGSGDPIRHTALNAFIARNYECDRDGRWFFQNGPQRVFVDLAYTPKVVRLHLTPTLALIDQCAQPLSPARCWTDDAGNVLFSDADNTVALLHDHDLALFADLAHFHDRGEADDVGTLAWSDGRQLPIHAITLAEVPERFGFVQHPRL